MIELPWIATARTRIGEREVPGAQHNPLIVTWWKAIWRGGIKDDETAWCSAFVGACFETNGIKSTRFEGASSWLKWGRPLLRPEYGCVVVFIRPGGYHVGFVVGQTPGGHLLVLGGNQGNAVCIQAFSRLAVVGYRWPSGVVTAEQPLPIGSAEDANSQA